MTVLGIPAVIVVQNAKTRQKLQGVNRLNENEAVSKLSSIIVKLVGAFLQNMSYKQKNIPANLKFVRFFYTGHS